MKNLSLAMPTIKVRRGCLFGKYPPRDGSTEVGSYKEWDEEVEASGMVLLPLTQPAIDVDQLVSGHSVRVCELLGISPELL